MIDIKYSLGDDMEIAFYVVLTNFILWMFFSAWANIPSIKYQRYAVSRKISNLSFSISSDTGHSYSPKNSISGK